MKNKFISLAMISFALILALAFVSAEENSQCVTSINPNGDNVDYFVCTKDQWYGDSVSIYQLDETSVVLHTGGRFNTMNGVLLSVGDYFEVYETNSKTRYTITLHDIDANSINGETSAKFSIAKTEDLPEKPVSVDLKVNGQDFPESVAYNSDILNVSWTTKGNLTECSGYGNTILTADGKYVWGYIQLNASGSLLVKAVAVVNTGNFSSDAPKTIDYLPGALTIGISCIKIDAAGQIIVARDRVNIPFTNPSAVEQQNRLVEKEASAKYPQCTITTKDNVIYVCQTNEWVGASLKIVEIGDDYVILHTEGQLDEMTTGKLSANDNITIVEPVSGTKYVLTILNIGVDGNPEKVRFSIEKYDEQGKITNVQMNITKEFERKDRGAEKEKSNYNREFNLSNGRKADIKVMPDTASKTAIERLGMKNCIAEEGCTIELKETGKGNGAAAVYEVTAEKEGKFLGIFKTRGWVRTFVSAETGEIVRVKKPFLTSVKTTD